MQVLGIDIGGSGIKGALVDVQSGELITERHRIPTPDPSTPDAVAKVVREIVRYFDYQGPVGCTYPGVVKAGVTLTAANVDNDWIGIDAEGLLEEATNNQVLLLNDADAAGIAEFTFGAGCGHIGTVIMLTFGTGIGSAIFINGHLLPNTEFGHMELNGMDAEDYAADVVRKREDLSWKKWGKRVNTFLEALDNLFSPDLYIIGGGVSKKHEKFFEYLKTNTQVAAATMKNEAGIIGAALAAADLLTDVETPRVLGEHVAATLVEIKQAAEAPQANGTSEAANEPD